jgi:diguanylate cyclase (GGDEF)-like protein
VLLLAGLWLDLAVLHLGARPDLALGSSFLLAGGAFALAEAVVLHVELGKNAHTVSLAELALTVSLFFLPAAQLPLARLVGGGAVLVLVRRQRPLKAAFNVALWVLDVAVATLVFERLGGGLHTGTVHLVVPAFLAALAAAFVDSLAVNAVIAATSSEVDLSRSLHFIWTCMMGALGCAIAATVCVGALAFSPWLLVPIVAVGGLYLRGFHHLGALRTQHTNVKVLYDFAGELGRTSHGDQVVSIVLRRVPELLRAERAMLFVEEHDGAHLLVTELAERGHPRSTQVACSAVPPLLLRVLGETEPRVLRSGTRDAAAADFLGHYGVHDVLLAPIQGEQGLRGVLAIANRLGEVNTFSDDDGLLLQTLASHAAVALANARLVERLDHDSLHDSLTGLANRAKFQDRLGQVLSPQGEGIAVLLMDLDRFKEVNDTLGHHHGDLLLQEIARRLTKEVRGGDLLARLGGDEFAVLMWDLTEQDAVDTAQRLLQALNRPMRLQGVEMEVGASIGVVHVPPGGSCHDAAQLLQRADVAMYGAKQHYTGVQLYRDELDGYSPRRLALASGLRTAIEQGQLSVRYQPQARLHDLTLVGAEALVCWDHPTYGEVPPDDFIAIAEQTGQIRELTRFVLEQSLSSCASWAASGTPMSVSVNLSVRNLMEPDLVEGVAELLLRHGVPGRLLTLEITESHLMSDPARTAEVLRRLSGLGIRLSIDDFGTGYSSLAYLKQLPVSEIKVDKSFVREIGHDDEDAAIVEAIIQLAHTLRLEVLAEGVEDERAQARLAGLGCDLLQGYHLARPMRAEQFARWLASQVSRQPRLRAVPVPRQPGEPPVALVADIAVAPLVVGFGER